MIAKRHRPGDRWGRLVTCDCGWESWFEWLWEEAEASRAHRCDSPAFAVPEPATTPDRWWWWVEGSTQTIAEYYERERASSPKVKVS